jgi:hypothetical protein
MSWKCPLPVLRGLNRYTNLGDYSIKATINQYSHGTNAKNLFYFSI